MNIEIQADGAVLYAEIDGPEDNPALLIWPPGNCTLRAQDHYISTQTQRFRVVRIDVRGWGGSSPAAGPETQYTFEQYAKDTAFVLDSLGIKGCHVWSQCWGSRPDQFDVS